MSTQSPSSLRVMWLLNHTSARKFELLMLKDLGFKEFFLPKLIPADPGFRSASIDYSEDANLTIPPADLEILNKQDWYYGPPSKEALRLANKYFDIVFCMPTKQTLTAFASHFFGSIILRAYGQSRNLTYDFIIHCITNHQSESLYKQLSKRFWFGQAYKNLYKVESEYLQTRRLDLPIGLIDKQSPSAWTGCDKSIFFVCPEYYTNPYYREVYQQFTNEFKEFHYAIGGGQLINPEQDPHILGYVPNEEHKRNMRERRVMFYHSTEPRHLHYHPLEAIQAGMPLVFMAGGILDEFGGHALPGRCLTYDEARTKMSAILNDDWQLINHIRTSQTILLEPISYNNCRDTWVKSMNTVINALPERSPVLAPFRKKIGIILTLHYQDDILRYGQLLARALLIGSRQNNEETDIVLTYLEDPKTVANQAVEELESDIKVCQYSWKTLDLNQSQHTMKHEGRATWVPSEARYCIPVTKSKMLFECDLWILVSDKISAPLLPIRPYLCFVFDYMQRYIPALLNPENQTFLNIARAAEKVLVTTQFTRLDAINYAGIYPKHIALVPMLSPTFKRALVHKSTVNSEPYFLWAVHFIPKNSIHNTVLALNKYYTQTENPLKCKILVLPSDCFKPPSKNLQAELSQILSSYTWHTKTTWLDALSADDCSHEITNASFLWYTQLLDNSLFTVLKAAHLGTPTLSHNHPILQEMNLNFKLDIQFMLDNSIDNMADNLRFMQENHHHLRKTIPEIPISEQQSIENLSGNYWSVISECL